MLKNYSSKDKGLKKRKLDSVRYAVAQLYTWVDLHWQLEGYLLQMQERGVLIILVTMRISEKCREYFASRNGWVWFLGSKSVIWIWKFTIVTVSSMANYKSWNLVVLRISRLYVMAFESMNQLILFDFICEVSERALFNCWRVKMK